MTTVRTTAATLACALITGAAGALPITYVASYGNDANDCSRATPCRSFTGALAATDADGTISVIDTAGYGQVTVNKAVSIVAPAGVYAGVTATSGDAITVNAGAGAQVALRGLYLNNQGGMRGIVFSTGGQLTIDSVTLTGFTTCIHHFATGRLIVLDTEATGCNYGISVVNVNPGATSRLTAERFRAVGMNFGGVLVQHRGNAVVRDSVLAFSRTPDAGSAGVGAVLWTQANAAANLGLVDSLAFGNEIGYYVIADGGGTPELFVTHSAANDNTSNGVARVQISGTATVRTTQTTMADGNTNTGIFAVEPLR